MIDFLSPLYLFGAAAAAIPLLIHLLRRRIGTRVEFPAVRYLARAEREHSRKLKMRNLLLMLLRVLVVLLVASAAARPLARVAGGGHAPTALALVLDNSLSSSVISNGRPVLGRLKGLARAAVARATPDDRISLITADGVVRSGSREALLDAIDRTTPLAGAGDLAAAATRAASLARQGAPGVLRVAEREVAVLTDGQASSWGKVVHMSGVRARIFRPAESPPANQAVVASAARPDRWTPRGTVIARILAADSATYRISLEGRTIARGTAVKDEEIVVRAAPPELGWNAGTVEIEPDELRGDDVRHFAAWIGPAPGVAVHPSLSTFAQNAVDALALTERVAAGNDVSIAPADAAERLPAVLFAPSEPIRIGAANRALLRLGVPWRFGAARRAESVVRGERDPDADALRASALRALDGVTVSLRYALQRARGGATIDTIATVEGEPWVVSGHGYVLIASPLLPDATTLPVRAAFLPWLNDVITQRLSEDAGRVIESAPNAAVPRPAGADALEMPGGDRQTLTTDTLVAPDRAGVYFFSRAGRRTGALVVNAEPDESVLERLGAEALRSRVRARETVVLSDSARFVDALFASAPRRPIVAPLLVIAFVALLIESIVAAAGQRRAA